MWHTVLVNNKDTSKHLKIQKPHTHLLSRPENKYLTCASRYVDRTRGFRSPPGGPTILPRPFLIVYWWLPREPRRKLNGEPGRLRLAWNIFKNGKARQMRNVIHEIVKKFPVKSKHWYIKQKPESLLKLHSVNSKQAIQSV